MTPFLAKTNDVKLITLTDKKWHWRARCSSLQFEDQLPVDPALVDVLLVSSVFPLAEFIGTHPEYSSKRKVIYFHENQLVYPVQETKERDFQYGYNQIMAALAANAIIFNSEWCHRSFIDNIAKHLKMIPDNRPHAKTISAKIDAKSSVVYFPIKSWPTIEQVPNQEQPVHIVWAHRWEHDKNPQLLFNALERIKDESFVLSVIGQTYSHVPDAFVKGKESFGERIVNWGFLPSRDDYVNVMNNADIAISTADHEFFGVTMVEAALAGCLCFVPNKLSYPEIFPKEVRYNTEAQLAKLLKQAIRSGRERIAKKAEEMDVRKVHGEQFAAEIVCQRIKESFE